MKILEFGYLGLATKDVDAWAPFAENYLGLQTRKAGLGHLGLRMDERLQRLLVNPADRDGFGYYDYQTVSGNTTIWWFGKYTAVA